MKSFEELGDECVAVAYAVAEFPFLEEDMDLIDQVVAGAVALGEQLMQREVVPLHMQQQHIRHLVLQKTSHKVLLFHVVKMALFPKF